MGVCYPSRSIANLHESTSYEAEMMDRHIEIDLRIGQKQADCCVLSLLGLIENDGFTNRDLLDIIHRVPVKFVRLLGESHFF